MKTRTKILPGFEIITAMLIILSLGFYIYRADVIQRPLETLKNYSDEKFDEIILGDDLKELNQSLSIFHQDRNIEKIEIFITRNTYKNGNVIFTINDGKRKIKTAEVSFNNLPKSGWYALPFSYEGIDTQQFLSIKIDDGSKEGVFGIGCVKDALNGMGNYMADDKDGRSSIVLDISLYIKNAVFDFWFYILFPLYSIVAIAAVLFFERRKNGILTGRIAFCGAFFLNVVGLLLVNPYVLTVPQLAENTLDFYYICTKYGMADILTMSHSGYMAIPQRLIGAFFIKVLGLGTDGLYYMQIIAVLADLLIISSVCLNIFRLKLHTSLRFGLSLMIGLLFSASMNITYFNFVYMGYFLLVMLICCNLDELKKYQYAALCVISALFCISKGFYVVMFPLGLLSLILFGKKNGTRKNMFFGILLTFSASELFYAFIFGGAGDMWLGEENSNILNALSNEKIKILFLMTLSLFIVFVIFRITIWNKWVNRLSWQDINVITMSFLFIGSMIIGTVPFGSFGLRNLFDWGGMWYVPSAIAMIALVCNMISWRLPMKLVKLHKIESLFPVLFLTIWCVGSIWLSGNHMGINYNCAAWTIYKKYFDNTVVPVFKYDERFGTLSDDCTLWYSDFKPYDNYQHGAPYEFVHMEKASLSNSEYMSNYHLDRRIQEESISAVYLNYLENVGNQEILLKIYNKNGKVLAMESQITPLSSKTIGFIFSDEVSGASYLEFTDEKGREVFVDKNIYVITKYPME